MLTSWNKRYDKAIQCIKKQRHDFADKALYSQSYGFSSCHVWMWELGHKEGWAQRTDIFIQSVMLEKSLGRQGDQNSKLKDINLEYLLEGLMPKLKLQCFGQLIQRRDSLEKTLMLGKTEGRRRGWQRTRWLEDKMWHLGNSKTENFSMCLWYFWLTGDVFIKFSWGVS